MKKKTITLICIVCAAVLLAGAAVPWSIYAVRKGSAVPPAGYEIQPPRGIMEFGTYPQSAVTNDALLAELNALDLTWISYRYYSGSVALDSAEQGDFMQYADVTWQGARYRAVTASDYRPYCCHLPNEHTRLYKRIELNKVYWFRWDPIRWIILDEESGLMMSESVLDCGAFCNLLYANDPKGKIALGIDLIKTDYYNDPQQTVYATDYCTSDVRKWLNGTFLETAFTKRERAKLALTPLDNRAADRKWKKYDSESCEDRVFLLSFFEVTNPDYGFSPQPEKPDPLRQAFPTDYAYILGCWAEEDPIAPGATWWWLRTPSDHSNLNCCVSFYGIANTTSRILPYFPDFTDTGFRPAIRLLNAE